MTPNDKDNLYKPISLITYNGYDNYKNKIISIPKDILETLEYNSNKDKIISHYQRLKTISNEIATRIDSLGGDVPNMQKQMGKLLPLFQKQQEHGQWLDILITDDETEKAIKQLSYGVQKYEFLNQENIHIYLTALQNILLNEKISKHDTTNKGNLRAHIMDIIESIQNEFDNLLTFEEKKGFVIHAPNKGARVCKEDIYSPDTIDTELVIQKMIERNEASENYATCRTYNTENNKVRDLALAAKHTGEVAEFTIWILTNCPFFTYDYAYYKDQVRKNRLKIDAGLPEKPIFYLGQDTHLYE